MADTFVSAIASADGIDPERGRPVAWLLGIARNVYRNRMRDAAHEHAALREIVGHRLIDDGDVDPLEGRIDAERRAQQLLGYLGALTAREREMVELVDLAGLNVTEAARMLRLPSGGGADPAVPCPGAAAATPSQPTRATGDVRTCSRKAAQRA